MNVVPLDVYRILEKKLGEADAMEIVKAIEATAQDVALQKKVEIRDELSKELANKADLLATEAKLREEIGKIKLYFVVTIAVIIITNPKALEVIGKIIGVVK
jgi:hypothetical protein